MTNIIFLDLDGPMIPNWGKGKGKGFILPNFPYWSQFAKLSKQYVQELPGEIVVNSTHNKFGNKHIYDLFTANGLRYKLHPTVMTGYFSTDERNRAKAVTDWLRFHDFSSYVIFDDEPWHYVKDKTHLPNFIQTGLNGISYKGFKKGLKILNENRNIT